MKMVIAIVQDKDVSKLLECVIQAGLRATRLASSGGFLRSGNTTLLFGVEEQRLESLLAMIREICYQREEILTQAQPVMGPIDTYIPFPIEVPVGGATLFVLDVEQFIRV
ncbi:MAG: cyclic-di-AMP receptor [Desulfosporosinus sp.]|nr:cyclic-di-AMP receptor [Desulfosporosinus sp.]